MDEQKKKAGAAALREKLRDGRNRSSNEDGNATGRAGEESSGNVSNPDATPGATFQDARGTIEHLTPTGGKPTGSNKRDRDDKRGIARKPERSGWRDRRAEESNGSAPADTATTERAEPASQRPTIGRLEASETINEPGVPKLDLKPDATLPVQVPLSPYKEDYKRTQRATPDGKKDVYALIADPNQYIMPDAYKHLTSKSSVNADAVDAKPRIFRAGNVLSDQEIKELYEPYVALLKDFFHYVDEAIWLRATQAEGQDIWGTIDDDEAGVVAKLTLRLGQKSPLAATVIRQAVEWHDYAQLTAIFAPRAKETRKVLREAPPRPKKQRSLFRKVPA